MTLRVAVGDLLRDEINRLTLARSAGEGVLYYAAHLKLRLPAAEAQPVSRGSASSGRTSPPTAPASRSRPPRPGM